MKKNINNVDIASWLIRIGLALVFLYAGISSLQHPLEWVGFLPTFMTKVIAATMLIKFFALYELVLVLWLISGKWLHYCAILCALTLFGIVLTNPGQLITTFRDIGLAFMALALIFLDR